MIYPKMVVLCEGELSSDANDTRKKERRNYFKKFNKFYGTAFVRGFNSRTKVRRCKIYVRVPHIRLLEVCREDLRKQLDVFFESPSLDSFKVYLYLLYLVDSLFPMVNVKFVRIVYLREIYIWKIT